MLRQTLNAIQERIRLPRARAAANRVVTRIMPGALPLLPEARGILNNIRRDGTELLPPLSSREALLGLRQELAILPCYDPWNPTTPDFTIENAPRETNNARIRGVSQLPAARALANHPLVLSIASNYVGCKPTIDDIVAWWTLTGRPLPKEEQFFHRDNDAFKFIKLFIYLSDVGVNDGAHMFIMGSHQAPTLLQRRRRYEDVEVLGKFPPEAIRSITGRFGTAFMEDTFGLHKGGVPMGQEPRLLFQVRYTSFPSVFTRAKKAFDRSGPHDPYINRYVS